MTLPLSSPPQGARAPECTLKARASITTSEDIHRLLYTMCTVKFPFQMGERPPVHATPLYLVVSFTRTNDPLKCIRGTVSRLFFRGFHPFGNHFLRKKYPIHSNAQELNPTPELALELRQILSALSVRATGSTTAIAALAMPPAAGPCCRPMLDLLPMMDLTARPRCWTLLSGRWCLLLVSIGPH